MGLVACPDCGHRVSQKAPACVKCGAPIAAQTIEATGKKWKLMQLSGVALLVVGFAGLCATASSSSAAEGSLVTGFALLGGLVLMVWGRFGAWWHHA
jgi:DNA-directed RNA polymerase subunit RPC12/RpoP